MLEKGNISVLFSISSGFRKALKEDTTNQYRYNSLHLDLPLLTPLEGLFKVKLLENLQKYKREI